MLIAAIRGKDGAIRFAHDWVGSMYTGRLPVLLLRWPDVVAGWVPDCLRCEDRKWCFVEMHPTLIYFYN